MNVRLLNPDGFLVMLSLGNLFARVHERERGVVNVPMHFYGIALRSFRKVFLLGLLIDFIVDCPPSSGLGLGKINKTKTTPDPE